MKIGFVVNDIATEKPVYTTTRLAMTAARRGHEVCLMGLRDFGYEPDGSVSAIVAAGSPGKAYRSLDRYFDDVQAATRERVELGDFDVVMLRSDPAVDAADSSWANTAGLAFGQLLADTRRPRGQRSRHVGRRHVEGVLPALPRGGAGRSR